MPQRNHQSSGRTASLATGALLFVSTAAFVLWQNAHLTVLWDLSYILENGWRIACGQRPYRDFPFPYPPLTYLAQAAIIKLCGRAVWHHQLYAALSSAVATVLCWRILLRQLEGSRLPARLCAALLAAPLLFLGTSSIYPHPFYDADCTLSILFCLWLLLRVERKGFPLLLSLCAGGLLGLPPLFKQNTGLFFLLGALVCIAWLAVRKRRAVLLLAGAAAGMAIAAAAIQLSVGMSNYLHWTMGYAASRRLPGLGAVVDIYSDRALLFGYGAFAAGALLWKLRPARARGLGWLAIALLTVPFAIALAGLLRFDDPADRVEELLHLWPPLLLAALVIALMQLPRARSLRALAPLMLLAAIHGAFLSQQLWGSTYALWPLLMILLAALVNALDTAGSASHLTVFVSIASAVLLGVGGYYAVSHERLSYVDLSGDMAHSRMPALRGLAIGGEWLPEFEELTAYAAREIPPGDAILCIPGEDLFYFATGRVPRFPVLMMDHTVNPYSAAELLALAQERHVRWVIAKRRLQLQEQPIEFRTQLIEGLAREFELRETLDNYEIYRRRE